MTPLSGAVMTRRALGMLGLCARAGRLKSGEQVCEQQLKQGGGYLLLVDAGASERSKKALRDACAFSGARFIELPEGELGGAIGKPGRMAVVVTDQNFAERICALCGEPQAADDCDRLI